MLQQVEYQRDAIAYASIGGASRCVHTVQFRQKQEWVLEETDKIYFLWIQSQFVEKNVITLRTQPKDDGVA